MKSNYTYRISLLLLLCLTTMSGLFAQQGQPTFSGGDGSQANPYKISKQEDLRELAQWANGTYPSAQQANSFAGKYFLQTADITFSDELVTPIATGETKGIKNFFDGVYDGGNHKIFKLNIGDPLAADHSTYHVGLFGRVGKTAELKNIVIANGQIFGMMLVGGIVGALDRGATISHCKVGKDVKINAFGYTGGIMGGAYPGSRVQMCVNYADVRIKGGNSFCVGGIVGSAVDAAIEGCANFGDIYTSRIGAGGIVGTYPVKMEGQDDYTYPAVKSCMNAADIAAGSSAAGGLIGQWPYMDAEGAPIKTAVMNSYSYGQSYVFGEKSNGPIIGACLPSNLQQSTNTFYDQDRFFFKVDNTDGYSVGAFVHGSAKSHLEMKTTEFLTQLNEGSAYPFEADKYNINAGLPILKWINDSYDPTIDVPKQSVAKPSPAKYTQRARAYFTPNRSGDFHIINMDMQEAQISLKSVGVTRDQAWFLRSMPIEGDKDFSFFMSTSFFRRPYNADGIVDRNVEPKAADHWLITPEFEVTAEKPYIRWMAGSEDADFLEGYKVMVGDADAITPEAYVSAKVVYSTDGEAAITKKSETVGQGGDAYERTYYAFNERGADLTPYIGKKIRLAIVDQSHFKFNVFVGQFNMSAYGVGIASVVDSEVYKIAVSGSTLFAQGLIDGVVFELYNMMGQRLTTSADSLQYDAYPGVYLLQAKVSGLTYTRKVQL